MQWQGVFPALTTKMYEDGSINLESTQSSVERLIAGGVSAVIMLPMLGENASLTVAEREKVIRAAKEVANGRLPVLSGLAELSQADAVAAAKYYECVGAEGLMVFPSLAYRTDKDETVEWYRAVASASGLPIMIYNNPLAYSVDCDPETLDRLSNLKTIVAVKEESGDIRRITDIYNRLGDRYFVFCGVDDLILESLALGVTGWVSGMTNAWPEECVRLFNLGRSGDFESARKLYRILTPSFHLDTDVKLVQYIKLAEHLVYGAPEWVRRPRLPVSGAERDRATAIIKAAIEALRICNSGRPDQ